MKLTHFVFITTINGKPFADALTVRADTELTPILRKYRADTVLTCESAYQAGLLAHAINISGYAPTSTVC